jgi:hypothetical protein
MAVLAAGAMTLASCGGGTPKPSHLSIAVRGAGRSARYTVPASAKGGLVDVTLQNRTGQPHAAQLVRFVGGHSATDALKALAASVSGHGKVPPWLHAEGGLGPIAPRSSATSVRDLPAGSYLVADVGGPSSGPPVYAAFKVTKGKSGKLPHAASAVKAAKVREHRYKWKLSGRPLAAGANQIEFKSGGKDALHLIAAFKVTGNPSRATILKVLRSNGPPPRFVEPSSFVNTAALDGGKAEVTRLALTAGPGEYVLYCPLPDREGGKPHFEEGLLTRVTVK